MPTKKEIEQIILSLPKDGSLKVLDDNSNDSDYFYLRDKGLVAVDDTEDGDIFAVKLTAAGKLYRKQIIDRG